AGHGGRRRDRGPDDAVCGGTAHRPGYRRSAGGPGPIRAPGDRPSGEHVGGHRVRPSPGLPDSAVRRGRPVHAAAGDRGRAVHDDRAERAAGAAARAVLAARRASNAGTARAVLAARRASTAGTARAVLAARRASTAGTARAVLAARRASTAGTARAVL